MKLAVASDHAGFPIKSDVVAFVTGLGHEVQDLGPETGDRVDYPDFAKKVAKAVQAGEVDRGILICGSGIGVSISANRFAGVRAVLALSSIQARLSREHNDANVLCVGARLSGPAMVEAMIEVFLSTDFAGGRHAQRVAKIDTSI